MEFVQPGGRSRTRWRDYISDLARSRLGVDPAEPAEVAENREVIRHLLGLLRQHLFLMKSGCGNE